MIFFRREGYVFILKCIQMHMCARVSTSVHRGSSASALGTLWAGSFFVIGCPMPCRMFSSLPGLSPLDACTISIPDETTTMSPDISKCSLGFKHHPPVEKHWYTGWSKSRFTVVTTWNTEFILPLVFINYCLIFHANYCKPTFALPWISMIPWIVLLKIRKATHIKEKY